MANKTTRSLYQASEKRNSAFAALFREGNERQFSVSLDLLRLLRAEKLQSVTELWLNFRNMKHLE
jgi:hypothetical protein